MRMDLRDEKADSASEVSAASISSHQSTMAAMFARHPPIMQRPQSQDQLRQLLHAELDRLDPLDGATVAGLERAWRADERDASYWLTKAHSSLDVYTDSNIHYVWRIRHHEGDRWAVFADSSVAPELDVHDRAATFESALACLEHLTRQQHITALSRDTFTRDELCHPKPKVQRETTIVYHHSFFHLD